MAEISISSSAQAAQVSNPVPPPAKSVAQQASHVLPADTVQLSADAKRHMEQSAHGTTIAEAFLKHVIDAPIKSAEQGSNEDLDEEEAHKKMAQSLEQIVGDISWLISALGLNPAEAEKVRDAVTAQSGKDAAQAKPPVAQVIGHAHATHVNVAVFVQQLSFLAGRGEVQDVSVQRVAVTPVNASVAQQLLSGESPRVVVVNESEHEGAEGSAAAFNDPNSLTARLAALPSQELQGMLIIRESQVNHDWRRIRVDALALVRE